MLAQLTVEIPHMALHVQLKLRTTKSTEFKLVRKKLVNNFAIFVDLWPGLQQVRIKCNYM